MQFLLLAILCSSSVSVAMRLGNDRVKNNYGMLSMNYLACMTLGMLHSGFGKLLPTGESGFAACLGLGLLQGFIYLVAFVLMQRNIQRSGVVLASVFMKLGLLVPMLMSILCFGEMPAAVQILGFVLALVAIVMINFKGGNSSDGKRAGIGLILLLLAGGAADSMSKVYEELGPSALKDQFLLSTFLFALVLCLVLTKAKGQRIGRNELVYGFLVGVPNYYSSHFILRALERLEAVIVYPSFSVGTLLTVTVVGVLLFRERLGRLQWLAVALILVALVLLNI